jgi:hypothetical protein
MRILAIAIALLSSTSLRLCGSEEDAPPPAAAGPEQVSVEAEAEAQVEAPANTDTPAPAAEVTAQVELPALPQISAEVAQPRHEGTVIVAQDHAVELVAKANGQIEAYVVDVHGNVLQPTGVEMRLSVTVEGGQLTPLTMSWDSDADVWKGDVSATIVPGPAEVVLNVSGRERTGRIETYVVVPAPRARVAVRGGPAGNVNVQVDRPAAPNLRVSVQRPAAPNVRVNIQAPPPPAARVDVRVNAPQPPSGSARIRIGR